MHVTFHMPIETKGLRLVFGFLIAHCELFLFGGSEWVGDGEMEPCVTPLVSIGMGKVTCTYSYLE